MMQFGYDESYFPPAPSLEISLAVPDEAFSIGPLQALVDTGTDVSLVPASFIAQLNIQVDNRKYLRSQWGERRVVDTYFLDVGIDGLRLPAIEIVADPLTEEVIVGRNILNKLVITLNGPAQALEIVA
jgi:predicted aspartyl protease